MWQRFTVYARRAVFFAQEEAARMGDDYVSTEHLLLGLLREKGGRAALVLGRIGVAPERIRGEIACQAFPGDNRRPRNMQLTPRGKHAIDLAHDEARQLGDAYVGTEHLLLGLILERGGLAGRVLHKLGFDLEKTRLVVRAIQEEDRQQGGESSPSERPHGSIGDLGALRAEGNRTRVDLTSDGTAFRELYAVCRAKDGVGYQEMRDQNRVLPVPVGIRVKLLQTSRDMQDRFAAVGDAFYVRVLEGEFAGRAGWVAVDEFDRVGPDDLPFPPEL